MIIYEELSPEAKQSIQAMIEYGLRNGIGMGMDEGFSNADTDERYPWVHEIEAFNEQEYK